MKSHLARFGLAAGLLGFAVSLVWSAAVYRGASGAASPRQAVERFLAAVQDGDSLGVAQVLRPAESRLLASDAQRLLAQVRRFASPEANNNSLTSSLRARRWRIDRVRPISPSTDPNLIAVNILPPTITLGSERTVSAENVDRISQALNMGTVGGWVRHFLSVSGIEGDRSMVLVAVRLNRRWYVSLTNTTRHAWDRLAARKQSSSSSSSSSSGVGQIPTRKQLASGANSAEEAVQTWLDAIVDLDYSTVHGLNRG
jgi:hypothetical protein